MFPLVSGPESKSDYTVVFAQDDRLLALKRRGGGMPGWRDRGRKDTQWGALKIRSPKRVSDSASHFPRPEEQIKLPRRG